MTSTAATSFSLQNNKSKWKDFIFEFKILLNFDVIFPRTIGDLYIKSGSGFQALILFQNRSFNPGLKARNWVSKSREIFSTRAEVIKNSAIFNYSI